MLGYAAVHRWWWLINPRSSLAPRFHSRANVQPHARPPVSTSARRSPFEHRMMGPRKINIKSGAYFTWVCDSLVLNVPLYNPNNSVRRRHFFLFDMSSNTSEGGSSTTWMPGKSGSSFIFCGRVLYAHSTIASKRSAFVVSFMKPTLAPEIAARRASGGPHTRVSWRYSPSTNVRGVKTFSSTLRHPLQAEAIFALVEICLANLRLASNRCGQELSPTQPSLRSQPRFGRGRFGLNRPFKIKQLVQPSRNLAPFFIAYCRLAGVFGASMRIVQISHDECKELLNRVSVGRLACSLEDQPYVVPVCFAYEPEVPLCVLHTRAKD